MSQKTKILTIIAVALFCIGIGIFYLFVLKKEQRSPNTIIQSVSERYSDKKTGIDLVQKALGEGRIDRDTALIYQVKFLFNDPTLPQEYFTENAPFEDQGVLTEVRQYWNSLSQETKITLAPYFKRPNDPESYISKKLNDEVASSSPTSFHLIQQAWARVRPFSYKSEDTLVTTDGKIRVWYLEKKEMINEREVITKIYYDMAKQIVANLNADGAYAQYVGLLGKIPPDDGAFGGDNKTDVYIVPVGYNALLNTDGSSSLGVNSPDEDSGDSSFILLRANLTPNELKTTTVHELFHAFQRAFPWSWASKKDLWWIEGTATWSEDMIYPKINSEQDYAKSFIPKPEISLDNEGDNFEYGAYVFPFFLSNTYDRGIITKVFEGCNQQTATVKSVESVIDGGFKKNWKTFTLWNYNKQPIREYEARDQSKTFPKDSSESGAKTEDNFIAGIGDASYPITELKALSAQVQMYPMETEQSKDIKKVVFHKLKGFTSKTDKAGIKAIIYPQSGSPYTEDWTDRDRRGFCFDKANEKFDKVVLIFSNAEMKNSIAATSFNIKTADTCAEINQEETMASKPIFAINPGYRGTIKYRAEGTLVKNSVPAGAKYPYLGKWQIKVFYQEHWPGQSAYGIAGSDMDFSFHHSLEFDLSAESIVKDGTFTAVTKEGKFETPGWVIHNEISNQNTVVPSNATMWDVPQKGIITEMTENGCKISLPDFVLYNSGGYRDLPHPIILEIKTN
jgi:hypothetical protein